MTANRILNVYLHIWLSLSALPGYRGRIYDSAQQFAESKLLGFGDGVGITEFRQEVRLQDKHISAECRMFHHITFILFPKVSDLAEC